MENKPLLLIDGSSYLFRAYHALPPLTNSQNQPTGAIFGVANMLRKLLAEYQPEHIAVVFDAPGKTFRSDLFAEYKAHRPPMPEDLVGQIKPLHELVQALGLPLLCISGVEADDVIGTLAQQAAQAGMEVLVVTGDKDMAQLVDDRINLLDTMKNLRLDAAGVKEKYGVAPECMIDLLALMGDSSDNIPGVPSVGPKTAVKWLQQYGSVDEIITHADEIKGKVGEKLRANLDQLKLSRQLATIDCAVALELAPEDLHPKPPATDELRTLYQTLEFNSWLRQLDQTDAAPEVPATQKNNEQHDYQIIQNLEQLETWLKRLQDAELFAFDTETTSLNYMQAEIVGVSFSIQAGEAAYLPLAHDYPGAPEQIDRDQALQALQPILENASQAKLGQNLKYDWHVLRNHGIQLNGTAHDTMLQSYVINSTASRHDMDTLAQQYLDISTIHYEDVAGKGSKQLSFNQIPLEQAAPYAAEDADITLRLHQRLYPELQQSSNLHKLYQNIEIPLIPVLAEMEHTGVLIDAGRLQRHSHNLAKRLNELEQQAHEMAGHSFNLGSPKQLQQILFEQMQLPVLKKTPKGQPSTAENVLEELADNYPLPRLILEHRSLAKLKSTYTDKLPIQINLRTGRVHTSYHQAVTSTGRLSSADPNLQNIPIRHAEGRLIRQAFIAPEGYAILAADYSQIELRIMAHLSGDERLLTAFEQGEDIHRATAAEVFNSKVKEISPDQRRAAKAINFGLIYGMSAFGLARQLNISRNDAQAYVDLYFQRYPGVKQYMENTRAQAAEQGYVETVFGRRLYLPEIKSRNAQRRQAAERTAINAPMQGTAADIIKLAMLKVAKNIKNLPARMIMQVHDELVFEVEENTLESIRSEIINSMAEAADLKVKLEVEAGFGKNWDEAH